MTHTPFTGDHQDWSPADYPLDPHDSGFDTGPFEPAAAQPGNIVGGEQDFPFNLPAGFESGPTPANIVVSSPGPISRSRMAQYSPGDWAGRPGFTGGQVPDIESTPGWPPQDDWPDYGPDGDDSDERPVARLLRAVRRILRI